MNVLAQSDYCLIRDLVYKHSRIALGDGKHELVAGRVKKRLRQLGMETYREYCQYLQSPRGQCELVNLIDAISTNYTTFFRDVQHFEFLRSAILEKLGKQAPPSDRQFRVWSAASSSGEEPYSIAICLADFFNARGGWKWNVEATDISTRILEIGRAGMYELHQLKLPNPTWLRRYFQRGTGAYEGWCRLKQEIRDRIRFTHLNLLDHSYPFPPGFQVVFCRNVMIYFDRATQEQLVRRIHSYLVPGGYLFVGPSESLIGIKHPLHYVRPSIYQKLA